MNNFILLQIVCFFTVVLLVMGVYYHYRDVMAPKKRISQRLESLKADALVEEAKAAVLRKAAEESRGRLLPTLLSRLEVKLTQAGVHMAADRLLLLMEIVTIGIGVVAPAFLGVTNLVTSFSAIVMVVLFAIALGVVLPIMALDYMATKRMKKFEEQLPVALDIFVRGLRAGHPISGALELLVEEMSDPIRSEFAMVVAETSYGYALGDALNNLANRVRTPDVQMFAVCVRIQAETGGNLADVLEGLAKIVRDRAAMVLKVRALASEGKMTAYVLSGLPIATFCFVFATQPAFYLDAAKDPIFMPGAAIMAIWYLTGVLMIRKMIALKV